MQEVASSSILIPSFDFRCIMIYRQQQQQQQQTHPDDVTAMNRDAFLLLFISHYIISIVFFKWRNVKQTNSKKFPGSYNCELLLTSFTLLMSFLNIRPFFYLICIDDNFCFKNIHFLFVKSFSIILSSVSNGLFNCFNFMLPLQWWSWGEASVA
jgi:hypothetical protein